MNGVTIAHCCLYPLSLLVRTGILLCSGEASGFKDSQGVIGIRLPYLGQDRLLLLSSVALLHSGRRANDMMYMIQLKVSLIH
jgi:hypothetical protein